MFQNDKGISVFREPRQNGRHHFHAIMVAKDKTSSRGMLSGAMLNMNVKVDVRVADVGRGADPLHRILRYVMVPTPNKLQVDNSPCLTKGFEVPTFSLEEAAKSEKSLWNKAASADEVYQYLVELLKKRPPSKKWGSFSVILGISLSRFLLLFLVGLVVFFTFVAFLAISSSSFVGESNVLVKIRTD